MVGSVPRSQATATVTDGHWDSDSGDCLLLKQLAELSGDWLDFCFELWLKCSQGFNPSRPTQLEEQMAILGD